MSLAVCIYAQQPAQDSGPQTQEKPNKQREVPPPPREPGVKPPSGQQQEVKPPKQAPEPKPPKSEKQQIPEPSKEQAKPNQEQSKPNQEPAKPSQKQHGTSAQQGKARPAGKSAHIPDPQFKANFGRPHRFTANRVITTTTIVPNQTQFLYGGYTFIFIDPWPADWLLTDDCYVDYVDDEYFLFDFLHPGIRVALFVVE
jgi:hypothetical protein